jgi:heme-degrading monooxygenase HmoA
MYARSTTVRGDPRRIDDGIAEVRDTVMPLVQGMDGFVGLSMLADRETGRCIVTSAWETEEARRASGERIRDSRARTADLMGAPEPEVTDWEFAVLHRVHEAPPGACARVTWMEGDPAATDRTLDGWRAQVLPRLEAMPGFCSVSLLVDRRSGRGVTAVTFEDREHMERTREQARALREEVAPALGSRILDVAEFELAIAHLRVPEMV